MSEEKEDKKRKSGILKNNFLKTGYIYLRVLIINKLYFFKKIKVSLDFHHGGSIDSIIPHPIFQYLLIKAIFIFGL